MDEIDEFEKFLQAVKAAGGSTDVHMYYVDEAGNDLKTAYTRYCKGIAGPGKLVKIEANCNHKILVSPVIKYEEGDVEEVYRRLHEVNAHPNDCGCKL